MEFDKIIIEKRPRLQCASFFISFKVSFVVLSAVDIRVQPEEVIIECGDGDKYKIPLGGFFKLNTDTLSQLTVKSKYISFRVNTNEEDFQSELLGLGELSLSNGTAEELKPQVELNEDYEVLCSCCLSPLSKHTVRFSRILALPSDNMDASEWFCHAHSTSAPPSFKPKPHDLFYGDFIALLNSCLFRREELGVLNGVVYCETCLQPLGETKQTKPRDSMKFWNDAIRFRHATSEAAPLSLFPSTAILDDFLHILRRLQHDLSVQTEMGPPQIFKIIFDAQLPEGEFHFLLLQITDRNLQVLRKPPGPVTDNVITLERCTTTKLLFRFEDDPEQPLCGFWLNSSVSSVRISPKMFRAAHEHLLMMSQYVPECYRVTPQGFTLSYLDI